MQFTSIFSPAAERPVVAALLGTPGLELVAETTGHPEGAARQALAAIAAGKHVAMLSKESECVVGPLLAAKARAAGLSYTLVEGDQPAGHEIEMEGNRHAVPGLDALLLPAAPARGASPAPYYLAVGQRLRRPVAAGALITCDDLEVPADSLLWRLRAEQDAAFANAAS